MIQQEGFECIGLAELKKYTKRMILMNRSWRTMSGSVGAGKADAQQTIHALREERFDWLIVDHYGLDNRWEKALRPHAKKIMVIDDLSRPSS